MSGKPTLQARPFAEADAEAWDALVGRSETGTFLHTRRFLSYHGERFADRSLCFVDEAGTLRGVLPAASTAAEPTLVASHPGATYGGLVFERQAAERLVPEMLTAALRHYAQQGASRFRYKSVPVPLHATPCQLDLLALWAAGARLHRRELWSIVDLVEGPGPDGDRRRRRRRFAEAGHVVAVESSRGAYSEFHAMLVETLGRHGTVPIHSLEQMLDLQQRFPEQIALWLARDGAGRCIAGEWIFDLGRAWHLQYVAASAEGRDASAQDGLTARIIDEASARGARAYSFGTSVEPGKAVLNEGLFRFKAAFGAGTYAQDTYDLELQA